MKELKYFNQLSEYTTDKGNFTYPTVSYVEENKEVYYKEKEKEKPYAIYRTTGDSQEVRLFGYSADEVKNYIDKVTIEETGEVITGNSYTFATAGDHKVYIELNPDITEIGNVYFNGSIYNGSTIFRINDFQGVSELIAISENLFSNCTKVTDFSWAFDYCYGLTSIPENLFSNNTTVTDFSGTFNNCTGLTGNTPVDSDGTPIYNRSTPGKEGYAVVTDYVYCFLNCTGLTDYSSIPSSWGGGA